MGEPRARRAGLGRAKLAPPEARLIVPVGHILVHGVEYVLPRGHGKDTIQSE